MRGLAWAAVLTFIYNNVTTPQHCSEAKVHCVSCTIVVLSALISSVSQALLLFLVGCACA